MNLQDLNTFSQRFEDEYLDELNLLLEELGASIQETAQAIVEEVDKLNINYDPEAGDDLMDDIQPWDDVFYGVILIPWIIMVVVFIFYLCGVGFGVAGKVISLHQKNVSSSLYCKFIFWNFCIGWQFPSP